MGKIRGRTEPRAGHIVLDLVGGFEHRRHRLEESANHRIGGQAPAHDAIGCRFGVRQERLQPVDRHAHAYDLVECRAFPPNILDQAIGLREHAPDLAP